VPDPAGPSGPGTNHVPAPSGADGRGTPRPYRVDGFGAVVCSSSTGPHRPPRARTSRARPTRTGHACLTCSPKGPENRVTYPHNPTEVDKAGVWPPHPLAPSPAPCGRGGGERSEPGVRGVPRARHAAPLQGERGRGAEWSAARLRGVPRATHASPLRGCGGLPTVVCLIAHRYPIDHHRPCRGHACVTQPGHQARKTGPRSHTILRGRAAQAIEPPGTLSRTVGGPR